MNDGAYGENGSLEVKWLQAVLLIQFCTQYTNPYIILYGNRVYFYAECQEQVKLRIIHVLGMK